MSIGNQPITINRFEIIFEKLEEAKKAQDPAIIFELEANTEAKETIQLFREYQETTAFPTYTLYTRS